MTCQRSSRSFSYQEGSQLYYYHHNTLGPLLAGELGSCLHSYSSVSCTGTRASSQQPELVMVLTEIQPTDVQPPVSTSETYQLKAHTIIKVRTASQWDRSGAVRPVTSVVVSIVRNGMQGIEASSLSSY